MMVDGSGIEPDAARASKGHRSAPAHRPNDYGPLSEIRGGPFLRSGSCVRAGRPFCGDLLIAQPCFNAGAEIQDVAANARHRRAPTVELPSDKGFDALADVGSK